MAVFTFYRSFLTSQINDNKTCCVCRVRLSCRPVSVLSVWNKPEGARRSDKLCVVIFSKNRNVRVVSYFRRVVLY